MKNQDTLQRFLFENSPVRGEIVHINQSFKAIMEKHNYPEDIRKLLGETLTIASLLIATLKFKGRLTVQFQAENKLKSKNKLKLLLAQCDDQFQMRGLAQWDGSLNYAELIESLKNGTLAILMDPDDSTQRYQGIVEWKGQSITESIENYFQQSEQIPTRIWLASDETQAAGFLLQLMPQSTKKQTKKKDSKKSLQTFDHIVHLTETITAKELLNLDHQTMLYRLYSQEEVRVFEEHPISFHCTCSSERSANAILLLGRNAVEDELAEKQVIVVKCEFCSSEYVFDKEEVNKIFNKQPPFASNQIH